MNPDAICSCGSGKQFKLCCGKTPATVSLKAASTWFLIGLLVCGITVMAWFLPRDNDDSPAANTPATNNTTQTLLGQGTNPSISNPQPGQYDPIKDQYWHTSGNHWDPGRAPASSTNPLISQPLINQPNLSGRATPNILNPQPNQYDPITDQYWHTSSGNPHWHRGRPPINPGQ